MRPCGEGDADASDQQRRQSGQGQIGPELVGEACDAWLALVVALRPPGCVREGLADCCGDRLRVAAVRQDERGLVVDKASRLQEAGAGCVLDAYQDARTEADQPADTIGLALDHGGDGHVGRADAHGIAALDIQTRQESGLDCDAATADCLRHLTIGLEAHAAEERIGAVDRLQDDGEALSIRTIGERRRSGGVGRARTRRHGGTQRLHAHGTTATLDLDIAAEQNAGVAGQGILHGDVERADGGDRGDAKDQAGEKDAQALHAAAEIAQRQPPGQSRLSRTALTPRPDGIRVPAGSRDGRPAWTGADRPTPPGMDRG